MAQNANSDRTSETDEIVPDLLVEYDPRELDTFALVPCSATKNPGRLPARDKYAGSLSNKALDYAEAISDGYAILSGKYGALAPYREIDDYDVSVRDRDADRWGEEVVEDLELSIDPFGLDRLVVLAGAAYREPLADWFAELEDAGVTVEVPLEGLRIGEQMRDLNEALEAIEDAREVVTDGGLPFDEDDVMVRRARLEPGRGEDVDEDPEIVTDGGVDVVEEIDLRRLGISSDAARRVLEVAADWSEIVEATESGVISDVDGIGATTVDQLETLARFDSLEDAERGLDEINAIEGAFKAARTSMRMASDLPEVGYSDELDLVLKRNLDRVEAAADGGSIEIPEEVNGWSLALEAGSTVRYEGDLVTVEIFGHQGGFDLKYGSTHTFQSLTLEEGIEDRESAIERLLEVVESRTPEEAGEHIERLQSDDEDDESGSETDVDADVEDFQPASELAADGGKDVGEALSELDVIRGRDEETVERRRIFIREVLEYLEEHGSASRSEIMDDLLPDEETSEERVGYAPLSAWKHLVRPSLSALSEDLDELQSPGERGQGGWSWIEPEETTDDDAPPVEETERILDYAEAAGIDEHEAEIMLEGEDGEIDLDRADAMIEEAREPEIDPQLREQVEALETGDVIRVKGTVEGEEVETRELEIVEDSASGFKVRDGAETYGVEITDDGVVAWQTVYGGRIHVDEIELLDPGSLRDDEVTAEEAIETYVGDESDSATLTGLEEDVEDEDVDETPEESDEEPIDEDQRARELVVEEIVELLESDLSAAQALDYYMTETYEGTYGGFSQSGWGEIRGTSHQAISDSVRKARKALGRD